MDSLAIEIPAPGRVTLTGDITHKTVTTVLNLDIVSSNSEISVDFSGVRHSDSSGLALMTHWAKQAKNANVAISFASVPSQLIALAKISSLDKILTILPQNT